MGLGDFDDELQKILSQLKKIHLHHNDNYQHDGKGSYLHALRKFGFQPPAEGNVFLADDSRIMLKKGDDVGQLDTNDVQNDSEYLCPVIIGEGTNTVTVSLQFDTGSSDLWVFSTELPSTISTDGHSVYDPTKSPSATLVQGATWNISYGDGSSATGNVYTDTVNLGGLIIKNQTVECAQNLSTAFASGTGDGLLGLAFDLLNTVTGAPSPTLTPVQSLNQEGVTPPGHEMFTCKLTRYDEDPGFYTFGRVEPEENAQDAFYVPIIDDSGFWKIYSCSVVIDGTVIQRTKNTAIADTGTTLCLVDKATCQAIYAKIPGSKYDADSEGWIFPDTVAESALPAIEIGIGDPDSPGGEKRFSIYPRDLIYSAASTGWIYGGVQDRGSQDFDILGDVFLKNTYAIWEYKNKRFGAVQRQAGPFHPVDKTPTTGG